MSRVIFMCGPAGSGKSTVARRLEADGMTRLSFDEEAWGRGIREQPLAEGVRREIETALRHRLVELVSTGIDVVLDYSFWSRRMRDDYRALLAPLGVEPETIYLATARDVVLARVEARDGAAANEVQLAPDVAARYFDAFEAPTEAEGPLIVLGAGPTTPAPPAGSGPGGTAPDQASTSSSV